jgi:hypothetical protein
VENGRMLSGRDMGAATNIKKGADRPSVAQSAAPSSKGPKLTVKKAKRKHHASSHHKRHTLKHGRHRHHKVHRHHRHHKVHRHRRHHRVYRHIECPFLFF